MRRVAPDIVIHTSRFAPTCKIIVSLVRASLGGVTISISPMRAGSTIDRLDSEAKAKNVLVVPVAPARCPG